MAKLTYFDTLNMSRSLYRLTPLQIAGGAAYAGYAIANDFGLAETVGGGTALVCGVPLAFKGAKKIVWDAPKWAYQNYGNYGEAFKSSLHNWKETNFGSAVKAQRQTFINGVKGNGFWGGFRNAYNITTLQELERAIPTDVSTSFSKSKYYKLKAENPEKAAEYLKKFQEAKKAKAAKVEVYKQAQEKVKTIKEGLKNGTLKGKDLQKAVSELDKAVAEADKAALSINAKPTSKLAKFKAAFSKYSGAKAASNALTKGAASKSTAVRVASKGAKNFIKGGGAVTAAVEFAFEVPDIVQTFRECGSGAGWKQIGKSATVAVASGVGYAAGAWAGGKIGAAIGSFAGPIGTVVGGVIGVACGLLGSWLCSKGAKALVGKSEIEKKREAEAQQTALEAYNDPKKMEELVNAYEQMINERDQMVQEGYDDNQEQITCPQDNTYIANRELDAQLAGLSYTA